MSFPTVAEIRARHDAALSRESAAEEERCAAAMPTWLAYIGSAIEGVADRHYSGTRPLVTISYQELRDAVSRDTRLKTGTITDVTGRAIKAAVEATESGFDVWLKICHTPGCGCVPSSMACSQGIVVEWTWK